MSRQGAGQRGVITAELNTETHSTHTLCRVFTCLCKRQIIILLVIAYTTHKKKRKVHFSAWCFQGHNEKKINKTFIKTKRLFKLLNKWLGSANLRYINSNPSFISVSYFLHKPSTTINWNVTPPPPHIWPCPTLADILRWSFKFCSNPCKAIMSYNSFSTLSKLSSAPLIKCSGHFVLKSQVFKIQQYVC